MQMKTRTVIALMVIGMAFFTSCTRSITPWQAANGKAKCGRALR